MMNIIMLTLRYRVNLRFLIENGVNVNAENAYGIVPLEVALNHAGCSIVRKLAWSGAKLNSKSRPHWKERLEVCLKGSSEQDVMP